MIDLIPSKDVREYIKKTGREFTDFEKAAIIYKLCLPYATKSKELQKIADNTKDDTLRNQISGYLKYNEESYQYFKEKTDGFVYAVQVHTSSPYSDTTHIDGYFANSELAYAHGKKQGCEFDILKYIVIRHDYRELIKSSHLFDDRDVDKFLDKYDKNYPSAEYKFDKNGNIKDFSSVEAPSDYEHHMIDMRDSSRIENAYVEMPNPFDKGDIVKLTTNDWHGIVVTSQAKWKRLKSKETIIVDIVYNGYIYQKNINPVLLEKYEPAKNDIDRDLLLAGSGIYTGRCSLSLFTEYYDIYKEKCQ